MRQENFDYHLIVVRCPHHLQTEAPPNVRQGQDRSKTGGETGGETGSETGGETGSKTGSKTGGETGGKTGGETGSETSHLVTFYCSLSAVPRVRNGTVLFSSP